MTTLNPEAPADVTAVGTNRWYLSSAPILRALVHLCVPMAAAMIVSAVYNVINAGFIGSLHDTSLLAAVTLGSPLLALVMAVGGVFGTGGSALISRLLGASEHEPARAGEIKHVASFAVWGAAIVGAVLGGIGLLLLHPLVSLLGADGAAVAPTRHFVAVMLAFVPVLAAAFCLEQLVRAEGAARQVMIGLIASTVANVVLDVLFILVLHWGVAGAALATGLANVVVIAYFATWLARHSDHIRLAPRWFTLSPTVVRPVFGVGFSELLQAGFLIVTALVLNNLAAAYGNGPLAAMGVVVRIAQVPEFLVMGVTLGVLPLLAYSYGKGDATVWPRRCGRPRSRWVRITLVTAATLIVFSEQVISAFSADRSVLAIGIDHPRRPARGDGRQRFRRPAHLAVPGDRAGAGGDADVADPGRPVHPGRGPRRPLVRTDGHHLGADRHRGQRAPRRGGSVAGLPPAINRGLAEGSAERAEGVLAPAGA